MYMYIYIYIYIHGSKQIKHGLGLCAIEGFGVVILGFVVVLGGVGSRVSSFGIAACLVRILGLRLLCLGNLWSLPRDPKNYRLRGATIQ